MPFKHFSRLSLTTKSSSPSHRTTPSNSTNNTTTNTAPHSPLASYVDRNDSPGLSHHNAGSLVYPIQPTYQVTCKYSKASTAASSHKSDLNRRRRKKNTQQKPEQEPNGGVLLLGRLPILGRRIQARQEEARALKRNSGKTAPLTERNLLEFFNPDYRDIHDAFCDRTGLSSRGEVSVWEWIGKLPPVSSCSCKQSLVAFRPTEYD